MVTPWIASRAAAGWTGWANTSILLDGVEVAVVIITNGAGWDAHGRLSSDTHEDRDGFAFLCDLDPVITLRFDDGSTVAVTVHVADGRHRFTLTEYTGPADRMRTGEDGGGQRRRSVTATSAGSPTMCGRAQHRTPQATDQQVGRAGPGDSCGGEGARSP